ncbi:MAG: CAP domain-containing protein [Bacteroidota bacterium]
MIQKLLRNLTLFIPLFLLILLGCSEEEPGIVSSLDVNLDVNMTLQFVNQNRAQTVMCGNEEKEAVSVLLWSDELAKAALDHSNDMQVNDYFDHTSQDGTRFSERAVNAGFEGSPVGENIAFGYQFEQAVITGWMESAGHCKNIMNGRATHVGVARSDEGSYWTMVLGRK